MTDYNTLYCIVLSAQCKIISFSIVAYIDNNNKNSNTFSSETEIKINKYHELQTILLT